MGIFTKEEKVHFERDEEGNVIRTTRNGHVVQPTQPEPRPQPEPNYKPTKQLEKEYYAKHPTEKPWGVRRKERVQKEKTIFQESFTKAREKRIRQQGTRAGSTTLSDRINRMAGYGTRPHGTGYSTKQNYNPFGSMFDTGMPNMPRKKSGGKKKYAIVSGKAYPIAGTGKKKKGKKKRRSSGLGGFNFDSMDSYGFFK